LEKKRKPPGVKKPQSVVSTGNWVQTAGSDRAEEKGRRYHKKAGGTSEERNARLALGRTGPPLSKRSKNSHAQKKGVTQLQSKRRPHF